MATLFLDFIPKDYDTGIVKQKVVKMKPALS